MKYATIKLKLTDEQTKKIEQLYDFARFHAEEGCPGMIIFQANNPEVGADFEGGFVPEDKAIKINKIMQGKD